MNKEKFLEKAKEGVTKKCKATLDFKVGTIKWLENARKNYKNLSGVDKLVEDKLIEYKDGRVEELEYLTGAPYFMHCKVVFEGNSEIVDLFFGKFSFSEENIYSWISPVSAIRFEEPGNAKYTKPSGEVKKVKILRKDQYMIVDGKIKFLATESTESTRELIYQDHFSNRKSGFMLPEIVSQMEKAQDEVIRANHIGPLVISGPAGSGKTTLALHRIAYLLQSPDLENIFFSSSILVLVQDNGTKEYFSSLLPGLGIHNVAITTFAEWACEILDLDVGRVSSVGLIEEEKDLYEYAKLEALKNNNENLNYAKNTFTVLKKFYDPYFSTEQKSIFKSQIEKDVLDKIDLTVLLNIYKQKREGLGIESEYYVEKNDGTLKKKNGYVPYNYSMVLLDEFQNYLPTQIELIKSCVSDKTKGMLYVGDMAQQVQFGTIKDFSESGGYVEEDRKIVLQKVYRNTKNILSYIKKVGYSVDIPEGIKEGESVKEIIAKNQEEEIKFIKNTLDEKEFTTVGILAKNNDSIGEHQKAFVNDKRIHVMTMSEAQGVEFDIVFIVGVSKNLFDVNYHKDVSKSFTKEKQKINKDLLYVALTRAISELYILGESGITL